MRRLKEQVKKKEVTAAEAREWLKHAAINNGDYPRVMQCHTWKWLTRRQHVADH